MMVFSAGCGKKDDAGKETDKTAASFTMNAEFTKRDLDFSYDAENAVKIAMDGESVQLDGENAEECVEVSEGEITIKKEGTYIVSGNYDNGVLIVDAADQKVQVVLENANITNDDFSCFYVENAKKVFLTLAKGSSNSFSDGASYVYANTEREDSDGAVFAKDDLTINGNGSLSITANYENGIVCKDDLKIVSAYISVDAVKNGIKGKDSLLIREAQLNVHAGNDGMKSDNDTDSTKGFVYIESGNFEIDAEMDGIQAETGLQIKDGIFSITSGGGSDQAERKSDREEVGFQGMWKEEGVSENSGTETTESDSAKGIKAGVELDIQGGTFTIDSKDDALHSNSLLKIESGTVNICSGDDGVHSDSELQIAGGNIAIAKCYEGLESAVIRISGGEIDITAEDDGINAAGGELADGKAEAGRMSGGQAGMMENSSGYLYISGGNIIIRAEGDGIDTNTDGEMSGGSVVVYGPSNGGNGSLDYGNSFIVTGGTLFTAGSTGMAVAPTSGTTQNTLFINLTESLQAGTVLKIVSNSGNVLAEYTPATDYASIIFSDAALESGETYSIQADGEEVAAVTQSDTVTSYGTGSSMGSMQNKPGEMRGGQEMPEMGGSQTPPEMPDGQEMPEMGDGQTPPEMPDGGNKMGDGQTPPGMKGGDSTRTGGNTL